MPLLLKFNKVRSLQTGGSTKFFATAGFTPTPTTFAIYNPGKLIEAYKPSLPVDTTSKDKDVKPAEFKFDGKGHTSDQKAGDYQMTAALNKIYAARKAGIEESRVAELERDAATLLRNINNAKERSLEYTKGMSDEVLGSKTNDATHNQVFNDGKYFGTHQIRNPDGTITSKDEEFSALDLGALEQKNKKLKSEGKALNESFVPMEYQELFRRRNDNYVGEEGDTIISTIAANGMGAGAAIKKLNETFEGLGTTARSELKTLSSSVDGTGTKTATSEKYASNMDQLNDLVTQWDEMLDPKVKNAVERQAWNNVFSREIKDLSEDKGERDTQLKRLMKKEYATILSSVANPKIKTSIADMSLNNAIMKLGSADEGGGSESSSNIGKLIADGFSKDLKKGIFTELIPVKEDGYTTVSENKATKTPMLSVSTSNTAPTPVNDEDSPNLINKNISALIKMKTASNANQVLVEEAKKIDKANKISGATIDYLRVSSVGEGSPFGSLSDIRTVNNLDIADIADDMVLMTNTTSELKIAWMPVDITPKESGLENTFKLNPRTAKEEDGLKKFMEGYEREKGRIDVEVAAGVLDAKKFGEKLDQLNNLYRKEFAAYRMMPYYVATLGYNTREQYLGKTKEFREQLDVVSSDGMDFDNFSSKSVQGKWYAESHDPYGTSKEVYKTVQAFIPMADFPYLQIASGEKLKVKDVVGFVKQQSAIGIGDENALEVKAPKTTYTPPKNK